MELINGQQITPIFNFYNIIINTTIKDKLYDELVMLANKVKNTKKGIWLSIKENIYKKLDVKFLQLLQKEFTFYYNDISENNLIFICTKLKNYPPAPNVNIGTHLLMMTPDNQVLITIEDDGQGNDKISIPGGHVDLDDNGIQTTLQREFGEEVTKTIKFNKKQLQLVTVRHVPLFPRIGGMYKNQDVWFLYKLYLSKTDCNNIIKNYNKNNEVKSVQLIDLETLATKVNWLTKDIMRALDQESNINIYHLKKAYGDNDGFFYY